MRFCTYLSSVLSLGQSNYHTPSALWATPRKRGIFLFLLRRYNLFSNKPPFLPTRIFGNNIAVGTDYSLCEIVMLSLCQHLCHCRYCIHSCIVSLKGLKNRRFNKQGNLVLWKSKLKALKKNRKSLETKSKSLENDSSRLLDFFSSELVYFSTELKLFSRGLD